MSYAEYPTPTPDQIKAANSEVEKYRHLIVQYCGGVGIDLGSQGAPAFPWTFSVDLPKEQFEKYSGGRPPKGPIHFRCDVSKSLPFDDCCMDYVIASHLAEDFPRADWPRLFTEWTRVLKYGGFFICLVPDHERWWAHVNNGGIHNHAHEQPQPYLGEMSAVAKSIGLEVVWEKYADVYPGDFTMIMVARKAY